MLIAELREESKGAGERRAEARREGRAWGRG